MHSYIVLKLDWNVTLLLFILTIIYIAIGTRSFEGGAKKYLDTLIQHSNRVITFCNTSIY